MRCVSKWLSNCLVAIMIALPLGGCTHAPTPVTHSQPSYSGNVQNSGIIAQLQEGFLVDKRFYARWVQLCAMYSSIYSDPPVAADFVLQPDGNYVASNQAIKRFRVMNGLHEMGVPPKNTTK